MSPGEATAAVVLLPGLAAGLVLFYGPGTLAGLAAGRRRRARFRNRRVIRRHGLRVYLVKARRSAQRSQKIPRWMRRAVLAADRRRCTSCQVTAAQLAAAGQRLQIDHHIPWSWGGLTCLWNLFALCPRCNRHKSAYWVDQHGKTRGNGGSYGASPAAGRAIFLAERRARRNPWRYARGLAALLR